MDIEGLKEDLRGIYGHNLTKSELEDGYIPELVKKGILIEEFREGDDKLNYKLTDRGIEFVKFLKEDREGRGLDLKNLKDKADYVNHILSIWGCFDYLAEEGFFERFEDSKGREGFVIPSDITDKELFEIFEVFDNYTKNTLLDSFEGDVESFLRFFKGSEGSE